LGFHPDEIIKVVADRDVWLFNLELLSPQSSGHERDLKEEAARDILNWIIL